MLDALSYDTIDCQDFSFGGVQIFFCKCKPYRLIIFAVNFLKSVNWEMKDADFTKISGLPT